MSSGGDGLGEFEGTAKSSAVDASDMNALSSQVDRVAAANGTATIISARLRASILAKVEAAFAARSREEKKELEVVLIYYFAVHGTSPDTDWARYGIDYPMVFSGREIPPIQIVSVIGQERLKKFMGSYTQKAMAMMAASAPFRAAMSERAARANLASGQEHLAIDFLGKDGSLSHKENADRVRSRDLLLNYRSRNALNISEERAVAMKSTATDVRSLNSNNRPVLSYD